MAWYFFTTTNKRKWSCHLSENRYEILERTQPEFATILDVSDAFNSDTPPEVLFYRGPMYFDWDSDRASLQDLLDDVKRFMTKMEDVWGFDLNQARWSLSGKKGIHCVIPMECFFDAKTCKNGVTALPLVYKQFAWRNLTSYMDLRVYSGGKGRMWRTHYKERNVDGRTTYKVDIEPDRLRQLDEQGYWAWVSTKRSQTTPAEPTRNEQMQIEMFAAMNEVQSQKRERSKHKAVRSDIFKTWTDKSEIPSSLSNAFDGKTIDMAQDLNDVGLQLATAAIALGLNSQADEDKFLSMCEGFIQSRIGMKGVAHRDRASISSRLAQSFHYCLNNPCYTYIPEAFAAILVKDARDASDLRGIKEEFGEEELAQMKLELQGGLVVNNLSVLKVSNDDVKPIADYSWKQGTLQLVRDRTGKVTHYSVVPVVGGKDLPRELIDLDILLSQKDFVRYLAERGGTSLVASTTQLAALRRSLLNFVGDEIDGSDIRTTQSEGLHFYPTGDNEERDYKGSMYWVESTNLVSSPKHHEADATVPKYLDQYNPDGQYAVDLSKAWRINDKGEYSYKLVEEAISHLLELNGDFYSLSVMLGWFTACSLKEILYKLNVIKNFPILQIVGMAGCGKTTTANLLLNLFTWGRDYRVLMAGSNLTPYAMNALACSSTTVPMVIDEVKPQNLKQEYMASFRAFLQVVYTVGSEARRGGGDGASGSYRTISKDAMTAPVCFLAEALEASQASIVERSVVASFHSSNTYPRMKHSQWLSRNPRGVSILGWELINDLMNCNLEDVVKLYESSLEKMSEVLVSSNNARVIENAAMVLTGFDYLTKVIQKLFGKVFDAKLEALRHSLTAPDRWSTQVASEVVRFLSLLASCSHYPEHSNARCEKGFVYTFEEGDSEEGRVEYIILNIERAFNLYRERMRVLGIQASYSNIDELRFSLTNAPMVIESFYSSKLSGVCVKIDPNKLNSMGVQPFKS